ncbi:uncharacterized protein LOC113514229 isoform X1 [Galleria mellonella]|uniref:Uncharacterized protein LOC113514229 isoform X1 n=1 Tax=Galleria mellonella TaxID=7137 RepID=A0A6J1WQI4_GALME|nr:uncharacterized protein LOC113514229 isoform X1 [Galleria mellonella]
MSDVSKKELEKEIAKILKNADLAKTSTNKVIQKLEEVFGVELAEKKKMIDQMVTEYLQANGSEDENEDDEEEEEEEEEEVKPKKSTKRAAPVSKRSKKKRKNSSDEDDDEDEKKDNKKGGRRRKGKGSGYTRAYKLSPALAALMDAEEMPRHEVVKRVWAIIKEKKLYDPNNRQFAICDDALYKVIGTKRFRIFGMMKYLKTHFIDE